MADVNAPEHEEEQLLATDTPEITTHAMANVNASVQQRDLLHERDDVEALTGIVTSFIRDLEEYLFSSGDDRGSTRVFVERVRGILVSLEELQCHGKTSTVPSMWQACWLRIKEMICLLLERASLLRSSIGEHEVEHESREEHGEQESADQPVHGQSGEELAQQESGDQHGQRKSDQVQHEASALGAAKGKGNVNSDGQDRLAFLLFNKDMSYKMRSKFHIEVNKTIAGLCGNLTNTWPESAVADAVRETTDRSNFEDPKRRKIVEALEKIQRGILFKDGEYSWNDVRSKFHTEMNETIAGLWRDLSTEEKTRRDENVVAVSEMKDVSNFVDPGHRAELEKDLKNMKKEISAEDDCRSRKKLQDSLEITGRQRMFSAQTIARIQSELPISDSIKSVSLRAPAPLEPESRSDVASESWIRDKEIRNRGQERPRSQFLSNRKNATASVEYSASHGGESSYGEGVVTSSAGKPVTAPSKFVESPSAGETSQAAAGKSNLSQPGGTDKGAEVPSSKASKQGGGDPSKSQSEGDSGSSTSPSPQDDGEPWNSTSHRKKKNHQQNPKPGSNTT